MSLRAWYATRSRREQRLLLAMVALAIVTALWGLVIRPFGDAMATARERHAAAVVRLGETRASIDAIQAQRGRRSPTGALPDAVRALAEQAGFSIASLDPDGSGGVRVAIPSARGSAMTQWLARIERAGVVVDAATLTDNGDRTVAARLVLRARAS